MKTKTKKRKRQFRCKSIMEYRSLLNTFNSQSLHYFEQKGVQKYEQRLAMKRLSSII